MLTRIEIDGFKSFTNFAMDFSPLTVIAGLNASGKSNLFDALHLLSLLAEKPLAEAFNEVQRGRNLELFTQYADGKVAEEMRFRVKLEAPPTISDETGESWNLGFTKLTYELKIRRSPNEDLDLSISHELLCPTSERSTGAEGEIDPDNRRAFMFMEPPHTRKIWEREGIGADMFSYSLKRTMLERARSAFRHPHSLAAQQELRSWKLLHLDPTRIPNPSPAQAFGLPGPLNASADNLAAVLWRIHKTDEYLLTRITQRLASLVPGIKEIVVRHDDYYNQYRVFVHTTAGQRFPLHLLSEGTLRMLALCTLVFDPEQKGLVGLEEVENGVHPARLKDIAALLRDLSSDPTDTEGPLRQVIVNTHSPGLVKACLEAVAGPEGRASGLTVWFSQLVSRPVEEDGKRVMRRVTKMLPVVLPKIQPAESATADLAESEKRISLAQLVSYLETTPDDPLLRDLSQSGTPNPAA